MSHIHEKHLVILLTEGALAAVLYALFTGNFIAGFLSSIGATSSQIATITMIPQLGCVLQLFSPLLFERFQNRKPLIVGLCFLFRFCAGMIILAPLLLHGKKQILAAAFLLYTLAFLAAGAVTPALNQWIIQMSPESGRGHFFAVKDVLAQIATALVSFFMGRMLDSYLSRGDALTGFVILYTCCIAGAVLDLILMLQLPARATPAVTGQPISAMLAPLRDAHFRPLLVYEVLGYVANMFSAGFLSIYQLNVLHLSHTFITSVGIVSSAISMVFGLLWGRLADRCYWTSVVLATRLLTTLGLFGWFFLPASKAALLAPFLMVLSAIGGASSMCGINLQYDHCPPARRMTYLGVTAALGSMIGYVAALLGTCVQRWASTSLGSRSIASLFFISGLIGMAALFYGWRHLPRGRVEMQ